MARARSIKPGLFKNEELAVLTPHARLLFIGLWMLADREGRLEDRPKRIKAEVFPYEDVDVNQELATLAASGFVVRYQQNTGRYVSIVNFLKHQTPHHMEMASEIPPPTGVENKYNHAPVTKSQRTRIFTRDGYKCVFCQEKSGLTIDHIQEVSKGGTSEDSNLRTLCSQCNNRRPKKKVESTTNRDQAVIDESTSGDRVVRNGSCSTDCLNLIPDSLNQRTSEIPATDDETGPAYWIERMYKRHPKKRNLSLFTQVVIEWWGVQPNPEIQIEEIDRVHAILCAKEDWRKDLGRWAPSLDSWWCDRGWTVFIDSQSDPVSPYRYATEDD